MKRLIAGLALLGFSVFAGVQAAHEGLRTASSPSPVSVSAQDVKVPQKPIQPRCGVPTPTTAAGFTKLWDGLDQNQWGAADLSISVKLKDGRSVWLYGDTFSRGNGFVHSTAITQDKGCLHVSNGGGQLLPNYDPSHIYWIESAKVSGTRVVVRARGITITKPGDAWGFKDGGYSAEWTFAVSPEGDLVDRQTVGTAIRKPADDPGPILACPGVAPKAHHFCYARHTHPEFKLASGKVLVTTAQNWDDGVLHPFKDYRPIFTEETK